MKNVKRIAKMSPLDVAVNHSDDLGLLTDDELDDLSRRLNYDLAKVAASSPDAAKRLEEELCYVQREHQMRATQKACHQEWRANQQFDDNVGDFDSN